MTSKNGGSLMIGLQRHDPRSAELHAGDVWGARASTARSSTAPKRASDRLGNQKAVSRLRLCHLHRRPPL